LLGRRRVCGEVFGLLGPAWGGNGKTSCRLALAVPLVCTVCLKRRLGGEVWAVRGSLLYVPRRPGWNP